MTDTHQDNNPPVTRIPYTERVPEALFPLFTWGNPYDEERDALFDYTAKSPDFAEHVDALLAMLLDEVEWIKSHGDPEVEAGDKDGEAELWAPYHALLLLRELAPAEVAAPLLGIFSSNDELLIEALPDIYSAIGAPSLPVLQGFVADEEQVLSHRAYAIRIIGAVGESNEDIAEEITTYLLEMLQREERNDSREDEHINGCVVSALCDLHAEAAKGAAEPGADNFVYQAIVEAFEAHCVDVEQISLDDVGIEFGVRGPYTDEEREENLRRPRFSLTCLSCHRDRVHPVTRVYYDIERDSGGEYFSGEGVEGDTYGPVYIPDTITCPRCGAVDEYKLSARGIQAVTMTAMMVSLAEQGQDFREELTHSPIRFVSYDGLGFGGHPIEAEARFRQQLSDNPDDAEFYLKYGELLLLMLRRDLAAHQFAHATQIDPEHPEPLYHLAHLAEQDEDLEQALFFWERVRVTAQNTRSIPRKRARELLTAANRRLSIVNRRDESGGKLKPNAPCPCGSGKKYKKCCMK